MQKDSSRRRFPLADRVIEVIDDTLTGEVLLDETLKMMKSSEKMSVNSWIDLLSGKTSRTQTRNATLTVCRRNVEFDEDRISIETSSGTTGQGSGGQGHSPNRKAQLPAI
jgi:hypothetical protein